jgi:hypothetical protein
MQNRKQVATYNLHTIGNYQKLGFIMYLSDFNRLCSYKIEDMILGNTTRIKLEGGLNLVLAPEYDDQSVFTPIAAPCPTQVIPKIRLTDESTLTVTLIGAGIIIHALADQDLQHSYVTAETFPQPPPNLGSF